MTTFLQCDVDGARSYVIEQAPIAIVVQRALANPQTANSTSIPAKSKECIAVEARRIAARRMNPANTMQKAAATTSLVAVCGRIARL